MVVCAVEDIKAKVFNKAFVMDNIVQAERSFVQACCQGETMLSSYPEDFILYRLGEIDMHLGIIKPDKTPVVIRRGFDVKKEMLNKVERLNNEKDN